MPRKTSNSTDAFASDQAARVGATSRLTVFGIAITAISIFLMGCTTPQSVAPPKGPTRARPPSIDLEPSRIPASGSRTSLDAVPAVPTDSLLPSPPARPEGFYYEAQIGDTLKSVAAQYQMKPAELRRANGLDPGMAPGPGQLLFIPAGRNPIARDR